MKANHLHAIVVVNRPLLELEPFFGSLSPGLVAIGNKPVIQITLEELYAAGIRRATILHTDAQNGLIEFIERGERWGMTLDFVATQNHSKVLCLGTDVFAFAVRGDILRPFGVLEEALKRRAQQGAADIYAAFGIAVYPDLNVSLTSIEWDKVLQNCRFLPCLLTDPKRYHEANMLALHGQVPGVRSAGRLSHVEIIVGKSTTILTKGFKSKAVVVGAATLIREGVVLGENVVIGDHCIIDRGAQLENCVIMNGTHIGKGVHLKDKVIAGNYVYCHKRNVGMAIEDKRILAKAG